MQEKLNDKSKVETINHFPSKHYPQTNFPKLKQNIFIVNAS